MNRTELAGLLERDWGLLQRVKDDYWIEQKALLTPAAVLRLGDELRRYVRGVRPDWPDSAERDTDLTTHTRLSQALRHAANYSSGPTPGSSS